MSASTAIGMVSETLRDLLIGEMLVDAGVGVTLLAPDESGPARRINLFLYKVVESPHFKNKDWEVSRTNPTRIAPPPLTLNLHYLLTAYAPNDADTGNANAHEILGEAMRVLHQFPTPPATYVADGLADARESLKIMHNAIDIDEITKIWSTFGQPYRLSVVYEVAVVQLDQSPEGAADMPPRIVAIGVPTVAAPFTPPLLSGMSLISGPVGSTITFSGQNLDGWRAYVTIAGDVVVDALAISGSSFDVTIPPGLVAGFHAIRVDISRLHRATFYFEVTP
ncbi:MAG: DUF4255 domain-containing protein [Candidatus Obscuribacterales bacterium]|nr:DUF4255 domain-containing protein [Steroidobacteraceae bacterium]